MEYDTSDWSVALVTFEAKGKAPKKYGDGVFRFGAAMTLSVLLPRRGWELIKSTNTYVYLRPPEGISQKVYTLEAKVPTQEQTISIAQRCYEKGESWVGQLGEWPAWYTHKRKRIINELAPSKDRNSIVESFFCELPEESSLFIGERGIWQIQAVKTGNEFEVSESGKINRKNFLKLDDEYFLEGKEISYELTQHERNWKARQRCLEHHGDHCKVCSLNFEILYGKIGKGFIHVHHIIPISYQEGSYTVDPINDLVPICPNCHAMIHRRDPPYSIEELKMILRTQHDSFQHVQTENI